MSKKLLAAAVLTLNEENDIAKCLESMQNLDIDMFVFDSRSSDKTKEIAVSYGATVVDFIWNGKYPKKKQWALDFLKQDYEWVLLLDADEVLSAELSDSIQNIGNLKAEVSAIDVKLDYFFGGTLLRHGLKTRKRILLRPNLVEFPVINDLPVSNMWEVEGHYQPQIKVGVLGELSGKLIHDDSGSLFDYFARHNKYSDWESYIRKDSISTELIYQDKGLLWKIFNKSPFRGVVVFVYSYIFLFGFLDGRAGFDFAANKAVYYWQIRAKELRK